MTPASEDALRTEVHSTESVRCIVIIGFMGAGKSTVGALLAKAIGWDFVDLDTEIARREGIPVDRIIHTRGLPHFRRVESRVGQEVLGRRRLVAAMGGGWPAGPGHMDMLDAGTVSIWLQVGAATAVRRIADSSTPRPLLQVSDPLATAASLLGERRRHYGRGDIAVDTEDRFPDEVVGEILAQLSRSGHTPVPRGAERRKGRFE